MVDTHTDGVSHSGAVRGGTGEGVTHDNDGGTYDDDARTTR
jgi:hypothetical protein